MDLISLYSSTTFTTGRTLALCFVLLGEGSLTLERGWDWIMRGYKEKYMAKFWEHKVAT